jgi:hypothetical protein
MRKPCIPYQLALTSPTGGDRSVGIVRSRTKATEFFSSRSMGQAVSRWSVTANVQVRTGQVVLRLVDNVAVGQVLLL